MLQTRLTGSCCERERSVGARKGEREEEGRGGKDEAGEFRAASRHDSGTGGQHTYVVGRGLHVQGGGGLGTGASERERERERGGRQ